MGRPERYSREILELKARIVLETLKEGWGVGIALKRAKISPLDARLLNERPSLAWLEYKEIARQRVNDNKINHLVSKRLI